jgi:hypothetical protein
MATATRTLKSTAPNGAEIEIVIERTLGLEDKISYADGYNINVGQEAIDHLSIKVYVNGKFYTRSYSKPSLVNPKFDRQAAQVGAYARLSDKMILSRKSYEEIMTAINELGDELTTPEYTEFVTERERIAAENAKAAAEMEAQRRQHPGWCEKCQSYCYGDCEA